jgi:hypothetical protein
MGRKMSHFVSFTSGLPGDCAPRCSPFPTVKALLSPFATRAQSDNGRAPPRDSDQHSEQTDHSATAICHISGHRKQPSERDRPMSRWRYSPISFFSMVTPTFESSRPDLPSGQKVSSRVDRNVYRHQHGLNASGAVALIGRRRQARLHWSYRVLYGAHYL